MLKPAPNRPDFTPMLLWLTLLCWTSADVARADVRLPHVIGSNMVLQREQQLPVWGWADAGEQVTVEIGDSQQTVQADDQGNWRVTLPEMPASRTPVTVTIKGKNTLKLENVLVGDVWVCSGQSNMAWSVARADNAQQEIADAKFPHIRLFQVPRKASATQEADVEADWQPCDPEHVGGFSAVGYFFGRHLHREVEVPIGLINTSWGGTRIEPWTPPVGFRHVPKLNALADEIESRAKNPPAKINQRLAGTLFNGMVHPLVPYGVRGAIWYQGEANRLDGMAYYDKMRALIAGWRAVWHHPNLPFYYVQLAPFRYKESADTLPQLWEAQTATLAVPQTGMAVTVDIGNPHDIHPRNKQDVGKRLALWALAKSYGRKVVYSGPLYKSMKVSGSSIRLTFDHVGAGLTSRDGKALTEFTIAGKDKKFLPALAVIEGEHVVVSSESVPNPVAVRFGWHHEAEPNLSNKNGLPASAFRTDRW